MLEVDAGHKRVHDEKYGEDGSVLSPGKPPESLSGKRGVIVEEERRKSTCAITMT